MQLHPGRETIRSVLLTREKKQKEIEKRIEKKTINAEENVEKKMDNFVRRRR